MNCVVKGCKSNNYRFKFNNYLHDKKAKESEQKLVFHHFPAKDNIRLKKWVEFCENEELTKIYETNDPKIERKFICSEHFEDTKYNNPMKKIRLMHNALPTIKTKDKKRVTTVTFAKNCKPEIHTIPAQLFQRTDLSKNVKRHNLKPIVSQTMTTLKVLEDSTDWPYISNLMEEKSKENPINRIKCHNSDRYVRYETEIKSLKDKLKKSKKQVLNLRYRLKRVNQIGNSRKSKLNYIMNLINNIGEESLNPIMLELIEYHLVSAFLNKCRQKWSNRIKSFCSELYYKSPSAYGFLQKIITLPSKKTVLKFVSESSSTNTNTSGNNNGEAVEQTFEDDLEPNDDSYVEQKMDINEEESESEEAVNTITLNTDSNDINDTSDKSIAKNPRTTQITIIANPIEEEIDNNSSFVDISKPRTNQITITPNISLNNTSVPTYTSCMKTYGKTK